MALSTGIVSKGQLTMSGVRSLPNITADDPLGLGIDSGNKETPLDPDINDPALYSRSVLPENEAQAAASEWLDIATVRKLILDHTNGVPSSIDPEMLVVVDSRTDYKIFLTDDAVYSRAEIYDAYAFGEFGQQPEAVFSQQEIGVIPARAGVDKNAPKFEYISRDAGDESVEFVAIEDMVGRHARGRHVDKRAPVKTAMTKVYVARERWKDFTMMFRLYRAVNHTKATQQLAAIEGGQSARAASNASRPGGPLYLADAETTARLAEAEERLRAEYEARARALEEKMAAENERREREARETQARLEADIRRLEQLFMRANVNSDLSNIPSPAPTAENAPVHTSGGGVEI